MRTYNLQGTVRKEQWKKRKEHFLVEIIVMIKLRTSCVFFSPSLPAFFHCSLLIIHLQRQETFFNSILSLKPRVSSVFITVPNDGLLPGARDLYSPSRETLKTPAICAMPFERARALITLKRKSISFSSRATFRCAIYPLLFQWIQPYPIYLSSSSFSSSSSANLLTLLILFCWVYLSPPQRIIMISRPVSL